MGQYEDCGKTTVMRVKSEELSYFYMVVGARRLHGVGEGVQEGCIECQQEEKCFYQTTKNEEDHEQASKSGSCIDVSISHSGHSDH